MNYHHIPYREALINGQRLFFDACARVSLDEAKGYYANMNHIGSSNIAYYDGVENDLGETHHFFVKNWP